MSTGAYLGTGSLLPGPFAKGELIALHGDGQRWDRERQLRLGHDGDSKRHTER